MNAQQAIDAFDAACEQDTAQRLANAEAQRYGEAPVILPEKPRNPWDQPVGSGDATQQWRDAFVCPANTHRCADGLAALAAGGKCLEGRTRRWGSRL